MQLPASRIALVCLASLLVACGGDRAVSPTAPEFDGFGALASEKKVRGNSTPMFALFSGHLASGDPPYPPGTAQAVNVKIFGNDFGGDSDSFFLSLNFDPSGPDGIRGTIDDICTERYGPTTDDHVATFQENQPHEGTFNFNIDENNLRFGIVFNFRFIVGGVEYKLAAGGGPAEGKSVSTDPVTGVTTVTVEGGGLSFGIVQKKGKPIQDRWSCKPNMNYVFTVGPQ